MNYFIQVPHEKLKVPIQKLMGELGCRWHTKEIIADWDWINAEPRPKFYFSDDGKRTEWDAEKTPYNGASGRLKVDCEGLAQLVEDKLYAHLLPVRRTNEVYYVDTINPTISRLLQAHAFLLGWKWGTSGQEIQYCEYKYLFLWEDGTLARSLVDDCAKASSNYLEYTRVNIEGFFRIRPYTKKS